MTNETKNQQDASRIWVLGKVFQDALRGIAAMKCYCNAYGGPCGCGEHMKEAAKEALDEGQREFNAATDAAINAALFHAMAKQVVALEKERNESVDALLAENADLRARMNELEAELQEQREHW